MRQQLTQSFKLLFKYRLYTSFAGLGLGIAVAAVWFIAHYVQAAYAYDAFHARHKQIYRVTMQITAGGNTDHYATTGKPLGQVLYQNYPGIEAHARLAFQQPVVQVNEQLFHETGLYQANPQALAVFTFNFIHGNAQALASPNSIVLTETLAKKYFNTTNALGRQLTINQQVYTVTGVYQDWPKNTHIQVNALMALSEAPVPTDPQSWFDIEQYTYVLASPTATPAELKAHLNHLVAETLTPMIEGSGLAVQFQAQPLTDIHFSAGLVDDVPKGNGLYVRLLALAGLLILVLSGLNYINLTLTRSAQRAREIRIKKILGISKQRLLQQSAIESLAMALLVVAFATTLILLSNPFYIDYTGLSAAHLPGMGWFMALAAGLIVALGLLGSSYTGVRQVLSSSSLAHEGKGISLFKYLLLGLQYGIAAVVLIMTLAMGRQLNYIQNKNLGFNTAQVVIVDLPEQDEASYKGLLFRAHLNKLAMVSNASLVGGGALPGQENGKDIFEAMVDGQRTEKLFNIYRVDAQYFNLLGIGFAAGTGFTTDNPGANTSSVLVNEALVKALNWANPLQQHIWYGGQKRRVIGVVKNFHNKSLHNAIEPIVFLHEPNYASSLLVKTNLAAGAGVEAIRQAWGQYYPNTPLSITYFDRFILARYANEQRLATLFRFFSFVSLLLCGMGLFALFSLHVLRRVKEMSIRKVLGASVINLLNTIAKKYGLVVALSLGLAVPLAWLCVAQLLAQFTYHATIGPAVYLYAAAIIALASLLVIAYHLIKVVTANPVNALRNE